MQQIHECVLPSNIFNQLKHIIVNSGNNQSYASSLAGNIDIELAINEGIPLLEPFLINEIQKNDFFKEEVLNKKVQKLFYTEDFKYNITASLKTLWVNFQKSTEFNPIHNHSGIFSFVIFVQIPYTTKEIDELSPGKNSNYHIPGSLTFIKNGYNIVDIQDFRIDKTWEQKCFIFPADLQHLVYPFYGIKEPRITVSGNFFVDIEEGDKK